MQYSVRRTPCTYILSSRERGRPLRINEEPCGAQSACTAQSQDRENRQPADALPLGDSVLLSICPALSSYRGLPRCFLERQPAFEPSVGSEIKHLHVVALLWLVCLFSSPFFFLHRAVAKAPLGFDSCRTNDRALHLLSISRVACRSFWPLLGIPCHEPCQQASSRCCCCRPSCLLDSALPIAVFSSSFFFTSLSFTPSCSPVGSSSAVCRRPPAVRSMSWRESGLGSGKVKQAVFLVDECHRRHEMAS